jgi:hypothetical protein
MRASSHEPTAACQELILNDLDSLYSDALSLVSFKVWLFNTMKNAHINRERRQRVR